MSKFIIYGLIDPRTSSVRYVGRSSCGLVRAGHHRKRLAKDRTHKGNWLRGLLKDGLDYTAVVLEDVGSQDRLNDREISWIAWGRTVLGWDLTNLTIGGDGLAGLKLSEEHKRKIGLAHKGKPGRPLSAAHKAALNSGRRGKKNSAEHNARISECNKGRPVSSKTRAILSAHNSRPVEHVGVGVIYSSVKEAAQLLNLWGKYIGEVAHGKRASYKGHVFRFVDAPPSQVGSAA